MFKSLCKLVLVGSVATLSAAPVHIDSIDANTSITLPIEVLSTGGVLTQRVDLALTTASIQAAAAVWIVCHRCGFYGAPEFEATTVAPARIKVSIRFVGGLQGSAAESVPWTDISDQNVVAGKLVLNSAARLQGGIDHGGPFTIGVALVLDDTMRSRVVAGLNRVDLRFNGTDGESNGFRVLKIKILDRSGVVLSTNADRWQDPLEGKRVSASTLTPQQMADGESLWANRAVRKSAIVMRTLNAACGTCHAHGGRDLQYFNYSDFAITQRAKFHGFSNAEATQVLAYIRASHGGTPVPEVASAAPWNPPYQPGPGVESRPIEAWTAGAGLQAVQDDTFKPIALDDSNAIAAARPYSSTIFVQMFGAAPSQATATHFMRAMDPSRASNAHDIPLTVQLPDWNAWLPSTPPQDIWPDVFDPGRLPQQANCAQTGIPFDFVCYYASARAWLEAHFPGDGVHYADWSGTSPAQVTAINATFYRTGLFASSFVGGNRNGHYGMAQSGADTLQGRLDPTTIRTLPPEWFTHASFVERAMESMYQWNAVQLWDLAQSFQLEASNASFRGYPNPNTGAQTGAVARGWPFHTRGVFYSAHHMIYQSYPGRDVTAPGPIELFPNGQPRQDVTAWERDNYIGSFYRSDAWYLAALILDGGTPESTGGTVPIDWQYLRSFSRYMGQFIKGRPPVPTTVFNGVPLSSTDVAVAADLSMAHYLNMMEIYAKRADDENNPLLANGFLARTAAFSQLVPTYVMDTRIPSTNPRDWSPLRAIDDLAPGHGLYQSLVTGVIDGFNHLYGATTRADWRPCTAQDDIAVKECLRPVLTRIYPGSDGSYVLDEATMSVDMVVQYVLYNAERMNLDRQVTGPLRAWADRLWPRQLTPPPGCTTSDGVFCAGFE